MQTHLCYTQKKSHTKNCYVVMLMSYWSKTDQIYMVMLYYFCHHSMYKPLIRTRTSIQLTSDANKKFTNITICKSEVRKQTFKLFLKKLFKVYCLCVISNETDNQSVADFRGNSYRKPLPKSHGVTMHANRHLPQKQFSSGTFEKVV